MPKATNRRLTVALETWGSDPHQLIATAERAETAGLDAVYLGESPTSLNAETWTALGLLAATTTTLRFGPVIANLLPDYRSPILLARQAATLAEASGGRFDFRTGVGASVAAGRRWWTNAGVAYRPYPGRWAEADRQLTVLRRLWKGETVETPEGAFALGLRHPTIPVTVAATGARGFDLARRHGDCWETSFATIDEWRDRRVAAAMSATVVTSLEVDGFVGPDGGAAAWSATERERASEDLDAIARRGLRGDATAIRGQLDAYLAAGIDQLVVALHNPHDADAIETLGAGLDAHRMPH